MNHFKKMVTRKLTFFTVIAAPVFITIFFLLQNLSKYKDEFFEISIDEFLHDMPVVSVSMNNQSMKLFIDFSGKDSLSTLSVDKLKSIYAKKLKTTERFTDSLGQIFFARHYQIDTFQVGRKIFDDVTISEDKNWGLSSGPLPPEFKRISGKLCLDLFQNYNLIYDFAQQKIIAYTDDKMPEPYDEINWNKVESRINASGVQILLSLNNQNQWFAIDTGSNGSFLDLKFVNKDYLTSEKHPGFTPEQGDVFFSKPLNLAIGSVDLFKEMKFLVHDSQGNEAPGLLGVNFLKKVILHINFKKNEVKIFANSK